MNISVGTEPTTIEFSSGETPVIQNLGPGALYLERTADVTVGNGVQVAAGSAYEFPGDLGASGGSTIHLVSDQENTDVRYMIVN